VVVVVETCSAMSHMPELILITEHYHFLKTIPLIQIENRMFRRKKFERQVRNAIKKFSKYDVYSITNYQAERNEVTAWINLAIAECGKIQKQNPHGNNKLDIIQ